jgi:hypothetical protein
MRDLEPARKLELLAFGHEVIPARQSLVDRAAHDLMEADLRLHLVVELVIGIDRDVGDDVEASLLRADVVTDAKSLDRHLAAERRDIRPLHEAEALRQRGLKAGRPGGFDGFQNGGDCFGRHR